MRCCSTLFQSTPVIANGRIVANAWRVKPMLQFQSTPVIANGRIYMEGIAKQMLQCVSIHARYC